MRIKRKHYDDEKSKKVILEKIIWLKKVNKKELMKLLSEIYKCKTVVSYCLKCNKNAENTIPRVSKTSNGKTMLLSKSVVSGSKK